MLSSRGGYPADAGRLREYAHRYEMTVLLVNHGGPSGGFDAAGQTAAWGANGELLGCTNSPGESLLLVTKQGRQWSAFVAG